MATLCHRECALPLFGSGGTSPAVKTFSGLTVVESLSEGHSFHAMAANSTGNRIIAGTKTGKLLVLDRTASGEYKLAYTMDQGGPVLAVHWLNNANCISSDTFSRLLVWRDPFVSPQAIQTPSPVCTFVSTDEFLTALTVDGRILVWDGSLGGEPRKLKAPVPPHPYAWVRGVYWPDSNAAFFPAHDGSLTCVDMGCLSVTSIPAHAGHFFALTGLDTHLLTIGHSDNRALLWRGQPLSVEKVLSAPPGVAAVILTGDLAAPLVLLGADGQFVRCRIGDDAVTPDGTYIAGDFRCGVGVSPLEYRETLRQHREKTVASLVEEIETKLAVGEVNRCSVSVQTLRALQREDLALAFEAEIASCAGHVSQELTTRWRLCAVLPDAHEAIPSLWRLTHLLVRCFLYPIAMSVLRRIREIAHDADAEDALQKLARLKNIVSAGQCAFQVEPLNDLVPFIEAWDAMNICWRAPTVLQVWEGIDCGPFQIQADDLARRCDAICREQSPGVPFEVEVAYLYVVAGWEITGPSPYVFFVNRDPEHGHLPVALKLQQEGSHMIAWPTLMFDPGQLQTVEGGTGHNAMCVEQIRAMLDGGHGRHRIAHAAEFVEHALRCVIADEMAEARRKGYREYCDKHR